MKKIVTLLLSALFLYGCGSGGGSTSSSNPGSTSVASSTVPFTLTIVDGSSSPAKTTAKVTAGTTLPAATNVRVIIKQNLLVSTGVPVLNEEGDPTGTYTYVDIPTVVYKDVQDLSSATTVQVQIPVGNNYTAEVITYNVDASGNRTILKYGKSPTYFNVSATGGSADVTIYGLETVFAMDINNGLNDPLNLTVNSKAPYTVTFANQSVYPFAPTFKMRQDFAATAGGLLPFVNDSAAKSANASGVSFIAPESTVAGAVYVQGLFSIDPSCLKAGESGALWTRIYPNPSYGEYVYADLNYLIGVPMPGQ